MHYLDAVLSHPCHHSRSISATICGSRLYMAHMWTFFNPDASLDNPKLHSWASQMLLIKKMSDGFSTTTIGWSRITITLIQIYSFRNGTSHKENKFISLGNNSSQEKVYVIDHKDLNTVVQGDSVAMYSDSIIKWLFKKMPCKKQQGGYKWTQIVQQFITFDDLELFNFQRQMESISKISMQ